MEADEDEDDVIVMGGDAWTPEELAAAESRFEQLYGLSLTHNNASAADTGLAGSGGATAAGDAGTAAARQQQQQQRSAAPVHVLPLYAMLPQAQQAAVFQPVPAGHRFVVVATNGGNVDDNPRHQVRAPLGLLLLTLGAGQHCRGRRPYR